MRPTWETQWPIFRKSKAIKSSKCLYVLFLLSDVPTGKSSSQSGLSKSQMECGLCFQMPPGSSSFPCTEDIAWYPEPGRQLEVPFIRKMCQLGLGDDNYWQWCAMKWQDESRILRALNLKWFFPISYLFLFFFFLCKYIYFTVEL